MMNQCGQGHLPNPESRVVFIKHCVAVPSAHNARDAQIPTRRSSSSSARSLASCQRRAGATMNGREVYLGDGLYASFDGWQIRLRAPRENGDHEVFLEDGLTLQAFFEFLDTLPIKIGASNGS